ncbi:hypothetical protein FFWV33_13405 [Flavobacterium faecale]|uniref:DUF3570 domain-containing protein n=1 Tax=Flavobacterium faecale TaxID=1355330 RepID=A0A2S1LIW6_9FLAO|nr:DUF3570 domain-containing protein [Flavobacterium faecale]AWG23658.1 hypothetical protein FFWV33_13405 [Flavobacterium faecale]
MKKIYPICFLLLSVIVQAQEKQEATPFKKRVLETTEVSILLSYYNQDGNHSAVNGGVGSEKLTDIASNIVVALPLNADDVLTFDAGISAYTSASSSNINPFMAGKSGTTTTSGASGTKSSTTSVSSAPYGTPWQASSGASSGDQLANLSANFSHNSDNRNTILDANVSASNEYDYTSVGFGGGITKLFNKKNTEISLKANAYLDKWRPIYPTELKEYSLYGSNFQSKGYFSGVTIIDQNGNKSTDYLPTAFTTYSNSKRNSYSASLSFSQILTKKIQMSIFMDVLKQEGLLGTPYQRIYFADKVNYYVGQSQYIPVYTTAQNTGVYQLADDKERLPSSRFKIPIGARINFYINEYVVARTYYRYYQDNWGIKAHTVSFELPVKLTTSFTVYPMYRYYTQTASDYFAPYETHLSTEKYYTSDYDLSKFKTNQYGAGFVYTDIFTRAKIFYFGLKSIDLRLNHYQRSDGLNANIASLGFKFEAE